jgi:hypothetical protein
MKFTITTDDDDDDDASDNHYSGVQHASVMRFTILLFIPWSAMLVPCLKLREWWIAKC